MQFETMQAQAQPFLKLAQSNMDLLTRFSTSPEVVNQMTGSSLRLLQSGAMAQLTQGMLKNYMEFAGELAQSHMAFWSEAQATMLQQGRQAAEAAVSDATASMRGRRGRA